MKTLFLFLSFITSVGLYAQADKYLAKIPKYNESSAFEDKRYMNMDWKEFYTLDEAKEFVDPMNYDFDLMNAAILFSLNKYRSFKNRPPLDFEPRLRDAAAIHTDQMVKRRFFSHVNPADNAIKLFNNRIELCGYHGQHIAENIARMFVDMNSPQTYLQVADKIILYLSKSKEHNINMLDPQNRELGCALIFEPNGNEGVFYFKTTHDFGVK